MEASGSTKVRSFSSTPALELLATVGVDESLKQLQYIQQHAHKYTLQVLNLVDQAFLETYTQMGVLCVCGEVNVALNLFYYSNMPIVL